eukprot:10991572-Karenia_brevis.AAC.1
MAPGPCPGGEFRRRASPPRQGAGPSGPVPPHRHSEALHNPPACAASPGLGHAQALAHSFTTAPFTM